MEYPENYCACGQDARLCGGTETFCWCCNKHEERDENTYRVCFECNHVYQTERDLEDAWAGIVKEMELEEAIPLTKKADEIYFCQECTHDF